MIWGKDTNAVQQRKDCLFSKWCWKNGISYAKTNKQTKNPLPKQKGTQKGLNVKCKTIKLLEENRELLGTPLVIHRLRLCAPNAGCPGSSPSQGI